MQLMSFYSYAVALYNYSSYVLSAYQSVVTCPTTILAYRAHLLSVESTVRIKGPTKQPVPPPPCTFAILGGILILRNLINVPYNEEMEFWPFPDYQSSDRRRMILKSIPPRRVVSGQHGVGWRCLLALLSKLPLCQPSSP